MTEQAEERSERRQEDPNLNQAQLKITTKTQKNHNKYGKIQIKKCK